MNQLQYNLVRHYCQGVRAAAVWPCSRAAWHRCAALCRCAYSCARAAELPLTMRGVCPWTTWVLALPGPGPGPVGTGNLWDESRIQENRAVAAQCTVNPRLLRILNLASPRLRLIMQLKLLQFYVIIIEYIICLKRVNVYVLQSY